MSNTDITLFDYPPFTPPSNSGETSEHGPSPFVWRVRLSLHYKKLPYKTVWTPIDQIEATCKAHDIAPAPGTTVYTVPCLIDRTDPNNIVRLMDSRIIVEYLERAYPQSPPLNPSDERTKSVEHHCMKNLGTPARLLAMRPVMAAPPDVLAFFEKTALTKFGKPFSEVVAAGGELGSPLREGHWEKVRRGLEGLGLKDGDKWLDGEEEPKYKDFIVLSLIRAAYLSGEEDGWSKLISWSGGKWKRYWEAAEPYML